MHCRSPLVISTALLVTILALLSPPATAIVDIPRFFSEATPHSTLTQAGTYPSLKGDVVNSNDAATLSMSAWMRASFSTNTGGTQLLWDVGSSVTGVSLVYTATNTVRATMCSAGQVILALEHNITASHLDAGANVDVVFSLDRRTDGVVNQTARLRVGDEEHVAVVDMTPLWSDSDATAFLAPMSSNICTGSAGAVVDFADGQADLDLGLNIYTNWFYFDKPVTGDWYSTDRPRAQFGIPPDLQYLEAGDYASINDESFNGKQNADVAPITFYVSVQLHPKYLNVDGSPPSPEVLIEIGGHKVGLSLFYAAPHTLVLNKCGGSITIVYEVPEELTGTGDSTPFLDIMFGRDFSDNLFLVVNGEAVPPVALGAANDIAGTDRSGVLQIVKNYCNGDGSYVNSRNEGVEFTSGTVDWNIGFSLWVEEVYDPALTTDPSICQHGVILTKHSTGLAYCSCLPGFGGMRCDEEDLSTLPATCYESEAPLTTGPQLLRPNPTASPIALYCDMDYWGGGNTMCGKFLRDNTVGKQFLDSDFGRVTSDDAGSYDLSSLANSASTGYQASHDCRHLIEGREQGVFMNAGSDKDGSSMMDAVLFTTILPEVLRNASSLLDVRQRPDALVGDVGCQAGVLDVFTADGEAATTLYPFDLTGAALVNTSTMWVNYAKDGAIMSASATDSCMDTGENLVFWGFEDASGRVPNYRCSSQGVVTIGTYCGAASAPSFRNNYLLVKATPPARDQVKALIGEADWTLRSFGAATSTPTAFRQQSATLEVVTNFLKVPVGQSELIFTVGTASNGVTVAYAAPYNLQLFFCADSVTQQETFRLHDFHITGGQQSLALSLLKQTNAYAVVLYVDFVPVAVTGAVVSNGQWAGSDSISFFSTASGVCGGTFRAPVSQRVNPLRGLRMWTGKAFSNEDRCALTNACFNGGTCLNGWYDPPLCECAPGFTGPACADDIDECASPSLNNCHKYADCENVPSTFTCRCKFGFTGNGTHCIDVTDPAITCPASVVSTDVFISWSSPNATDNVDDGVSVSCDTRPQTFPIGTTAVTCTATDAAGNQAQCSFDVTRLDAQPPVFPECPAAMVVGTDRFSNKHTLSYAVPLAIDNHIPNVPVTCTPEPGEDVAIGTTSVTCVADDGRNRAFCSFSITVEDQEPPLLSCPGDVQTTAPPGATSVNTIALPNPTALDAVDNDPSSLDVSCNATANQPFLVGYTVVECSAEDTSGNRATCTFEVVVRDETNPTVTCPANMGVATDAGMPTAVVDTVSLLTASDNGRIARKACTWDASTPMPIGSNTVTCEVEDEFANSASCSFTVTVSDAEPPVIVCSNNVTVSTEVSVADAAVTFGLPSVSDNSGRVASVSCDTPTQGRFGIGETIVRCSARDVAGNSASCALSISVMDTEPPALGCPPAMSVSTDAGLSTAAIEFAPTASDNSGMSVAINCTVPSPADLGVGAYAVACSAADVSGNRATCTFDVVVFDEEPPVLSCPDSLQLKAPGNATSVVANWTTVAAADNSGEPVTVTCSHNVGDALNVSVHHVDCSARDAYGNTDECAFVVTVQSDLAPTVTCPNDIVTQTSLGTSVAVVRWADAATAVDNADATLPTRCFPPAGRRFEIGAHFPYCMAVDASSRVGYCSFKVTVLDVEPPVWECPDHITITTARNESYGVLNATTPTVSDNSGQVVAQSCTHAHGDLLPFGDTTRRCEAADPSGNRAVCNTTITVVDAQPPSITFLQPDLVVETKFRESYAVVVLPDPVAWDNVGVTRVSCNASSGAFAIGVHHVRCEAEDAAGNTNAGQYRVTVVDVEPPVLTCPQSRVVVVRAGPGGDVDGDSAFYLSTTSPVTTTDVRTAPVIPTTPTAGMTMPGLATMNVSASKTATSTAATSTTTTTTTTTESEPSAAAKSRSRRETSRTGEDNTLTLLLVGTRELFTVYYGDNSDSDRQAASITISCVVVDGSPALGVGNVTRVQCSGVDASMNEASCSFLIAVQTADAPELACDGPVTVVAVDGTAAPVSVQAPVQTRASEPLALSVAECVLPASSELPVGEHDVVCFGKVVDLVPATSSAAPTTAAPASDDDDTAVGTSTNSDGDDDDDYDHVASAPTTLPATSESFIGFCFSRVYVLEATPPDIECPSDVRVALPSTPLAQTAAVVLLDPAASDNEGLAGVSCSEPNIASFPAGRHTVNCTAVDVYGNRATCGYTVTVIDEHPPVLECPTLVSTTVSRLTEAAVAVDIGIIEARDNTGATFSTADSSSNGGGDGLVGDLVVACSAPAGGRFPVGQRTEVTCTSTDAAGNTGTCAFAVEVGVDCIGQWSEWVCERCPNRVEHRAFQVSAFPVLGGAACPGEQQRACVDAEPCFFLRTSLVIGPVLDIDAAMGPLRADLVAFLTDVLPQIARVYGVEYDEAMASMTIEGVFATSAPTPAVTISDTTDASISNSNSANTVDDDGAGDAAANGMRRRSSDDDDDDGGSAGDDDGSIAEVVKDHLKVSVLIDAERTPALAMLDALEATMSDSSNTAAVAANEVLAILRAGDPEDVFEDVSVAVFTSVTAQSVLETTSTTVLTTSNTPTTVGSRTETSLQAQVPLIAGVCAAALILVVLIVGAVLVRLRKDEPIVLARRSPSTRRHRTSTLKRSDIIKIRGLHHEEEAEYLEMNTLNNPLYDSKDGTNGSDGEEEEDLYDVVRAPNASDTSSDDDDDIMGKDMFDFAGDEDEEDADDGFGLFGGTVERNDYSSANNMPVEEMSDDDLDAQVDMDMVAAFERRDPLGLSANKNRNSSYGGDSGDDDDDYDDNDGDGDDEEDISGLFGFGQQDPIVADLMDGLMSSEKMINHRKIQNLEEKNRELQRQLSMYTSQQPSPMRGASLTEGPVMTSTPVPVGVADDDKNAPSRVSVERPATLWMDDGDGDGDDDVVPPGGVETSADEWLPR
ncbi:epidermal growth factor [Salpingoeca rosetta]|uniref:Epidermal growth factor n=1 Tax=Salpingoeca rosetta (strain ATCC 50818 / BSB-021) TaxID=946362 RepID=F2UGQ8_SALR5|nr:epidermal growth factor [Salpingoeca rosetta]EGD75808.1 epidermal growth factor [Salpingoeca rosetta]|eukprot:XP_004991729.1 epidermal growth factor [Salpingoeca rosetta]